MSIDKIKKEDVFIIIPAYNESGPISSVLGSVKQLGWHNIVVVDDGSSDDTYEKAISSNVLALRHPINCGKGAAVKTGLELALGLKAKIIVVMDADTQHNPSNIENLVGKIEQGFDVVLGVREFNPKEMPLIKIIANRIANFITFLRYGISVRDSQCGFRAFTSGALRAMEINAYSYDLESFMLGEIKKLNLKYTEVFVDTIYTSYSEGKTTRQNFLNGLKTFYKLFSK